MVSPYSPHQTPGAQHTVMVDQRPKVAAALRRLRETGAPQWVTLSGERLLLGPLTPAFLEHGRGEVLVAAGRGYRVLDLQGRRPLLGRGPAVLVGPTHRRVTERRLRARVLERHPRRAATP